MTDRFSPNWDRLQGPLDAIIRFLAGDEHLLVRAFSSVAGPRFKANSASEVRTQLRGMSMTKGVPWILFDSISALIRSLPEPTRKALVNTIGIPTPHPFEKLRPDLEGRWQVVWEMDGNATTDYREVAAIWYVPGDQSSAPIVPLAILDYIAGSVSLLRNDLTLPGLALLLIALESALWDDLAAKSISRHSDRVTYEPVEWTFKRVAEKLVLVSSGGTDRNLREMRPAEGRCEIRKLRNNDSKAFLQLELEADLVGFLASEREETRETFAEKGLSEAIQRARKAGILASVPSQFDETIVKLRNNLIHIPSRGVLDPPIPAPTGGVFLTSDELRDDPDLAKGLMPLIVELINTIYVAP